MRTPSLPGLGEARCPSLSGSGYGGRRGGVALLDLPSFVAAVYFWDERNSMPREEFLDSIYFHSPLGATGSALHSITRSLSFSPLLGA
jgi:hypothetical protein